MGVGESYNLNGCGDSTKIKSGMPSVSHSFDPDQAGCFVWPA